MASGIVIQSTSKAPKVRVPRSWRKERIEPTHFIYNGWIERGGKGSGKGTPDIPAFGAGWRAVYLESEGRRWATLVECGTGDRTRVELETWRRLVRHGRVLA